MTSVLREADIVRRTEAHRIRRLGAYAVAVRPGAVLLTRLSSRGFPAGSWALPGGGVDHGEPPYEAMVRELYEETGLVPRAARLADVHSVHVVERGRDDRLEDYHGVHVLYAVDVDVSAEPRVTEADGTTDLARWVPLDQAPRLPTLPVVDHVMGRLDDYVGGTLNRNT